MRKFLGLFLLFFSVNIFATANYSPWAAPTRIDVMRHQGLVVYGSFGNSAGCTVSDAVYLPIGLTQYKEIYSLLLTAIAQGKEVSIYTSTCTTLLWFSASATYNTVSGDDLTVNIRD